MKQTILTTLLTLAVKVPAYAQSEYLLDGGRVWCGDVSTPGANFCALGPS